MRNAALVLGVIGGSLALIVGFFGWGYTAFIARNGEVGDLARQVENPFLVQAASLFSPLLAIAGAAMARSVNRAGGVMMLLASAGLYAGFGFNVFTMFPIALCGLGGVLALAARQPDPY